MSLRHIIQPTATVTLSDGQTFTVNGLSPNHVFGLYHRHRGQVGGLFDAIMAGDRTPEFIVGFTSNLFQNAPLLLAEIIALSAGGNPYDESPVDPEIPEGVNAWQAEVAVAAALPFPVQVDALNKIGELTFTTDMPPKKFLGVLVAMIKDARAMAEAEITTSEISTGA